MNDDITEQNLIIINAHKLQKLKDYPNKTLLKMYTVNPGLLQ